MLPSVRYPIFPSAYFWGALAAFITAACRVRGRRKARQLILYYSSLSPIRHASRNVSRPLAAFQSKPIRPNMHVVEVDATVNLTGPKQ
ncbi:hypothetical protein V8F20_012106 [Naviculisporaceae sp. PSN 640]